jgi:hypothetical protein
MDFPTAAAIADLRNQTASGRVFSCYFGPARAVNLNSPQGLRWQRRVAVGKEG